MKAQVVYRHAGQSRYVLETAQGRYYLVNCRRGTDMSPGEYISGDFELHEVSWFLNLTRAKLVDVVLVTPCATLDAAIAAGTSSGRRRSDTRTVAPTATARAVQL